MSLYSFRSRIRNVPYEDHFLRFVQIIKPDNFIMENVPGMKSMTAEKGENSLIIILQTFKDVGYRLIGES